MAAVLENNEVVARQWGQREDECNNQIVVGYVGGKRALDNMTRGGGGQNKTSEWGTTRGNLAASDARRSGSGRHDSHRVVDNTTRGHWVVNDTMREGADKARRLSGK